MTKVVHLIPSLAHGGAESMLAKLVTHRERSRFNHAVVSMTGRGPLADDIETAGVTVTALGMKRGTPDPIGIARLHTYLRRESPDVLSTWLFHADLLGLVSATTARVPRIVWNVQCADLELSEHPWLLRASVGLLALASHHPAAIVVNSAAGRTAIERLGYAPRRCELIPSGFDLERFVPGHASRTLVRRDLGLPTDAPIVGLVARYHPMKDHETFIRAAALVHRDRPEVHFVLAGRDVDHGNDSLMKWIHDAKLESHVHCVGLWPHVVELLQALDIACCSSYSEGLPNILGEAMACGVPCVSTDVGDCATLIGDTGYVVPPRDPEAFANALRAFLDRGVDARREAGLAARKRVQDNYDIVGVARKYENLFTDILSQPDAARRPS